MEVNDRLVVIMVVVDFRLVKVFGWGGLGVVSMYDVVGKDNKMLWVVCKIDIFFYYLCIFCEVKVYFMIVGVKYVM